MTKKQAHCNRYSDIEHWLSFLALALIVTGCQHSSQKAIPPRLISPIEFAGFTISNTTPEAATKLMDQKIKSFGEYFEVREQMIAHDGYDFLVDANGKRIRTETVNQYKARDRLAYAQMTLDMRAEDIMREIQSKLEFMAKAKPSKQSFLGTNYFLQLPGSILSGSVSGDQDEELKREANLTVEDYLKPGMLLRVENVVYGTNSVRFKETVNDYGYWIREWARGDVNEDGFEDALVCVGIQTGGTLGWVGFSVVTRIGRGLGLEFV